MQHGHPSAARAGRAALPLRLWPPGAIWLLLLLASALALGSQLGCRSPQTADGAGGQSGDEGCRGAPLPPPR